MPADTTPARPTAEQLARYAEKFNRSKALRHFGAELSFEEGKAVVTVAVQDVHRGGLGTSAVNGGVLAAMFDLAIGCTPALLDPTRRNATMQLSMSFERPLMGDLLRAEAWIDTAGSATIFSSAKILDARGQVCARAQGLVKLGRGSWRDGESPAFE